MIRILFILCMACLAPAAWSAVPPPVDLDRRVGYDQHIGDVMPMDASLRDAGGHATSLATAAGGKPLLLAFGYYRCPNLCDLTLHGMAEATRKLSLAAGRDYRVAFVSIDPRETAADARDAQAMLDGMLPDAHISTWTFATGAESSLGPLTRAAGFRYFYDDRNRQFAHPAGLLVITADGHVAQYLFGVTYDPRTLHLALVDASRGRVGSVIDQLVLFCCGYDPTTGRYSLLVSRIMMVLGCAFVLAMAGFWWRLRGTRP